MSQRLTTMLAVSNAAAATSEAEAVRVAPETAMAASVPAQTMKTPRLTQQSQPGGLIELGCLGLGIVGGGWLLVRADWYSSILVLNVTIAVSNAITAMRNRREFLRISNMADATAEPSRVKAGRINLVEEVE
jgi:hypothetical protein